MCTCCVHAVYMHSYVHTPRCMCRALVEVELLWNVHLCTLDALVLGSATMQYYTRTYLLILGSSAVLHTDIGMPTKQCT